MRDLSRIQGLAGRAQSRPLDAGEAMRQVLWVALCSLLAGVQAEPGVLLRLGMDVMNHGESVDPGVGLEGGVWSSGGGDCSWSQGLEQAMRSK